MPKHADTNTEALSEPLEDYLEIIQALCLEHGHAHLNDIAVRHQVKKSSVNNALRILRDKGLLSYERYRPVVLTAQGEKIASAVLRRHAVLTAFFNTAVGLSSTEAESVACRIEHVLDDTMIDKLVSAFERLNPAPARRKRRGSSARTPRA